METAAICASAKDERRAAFTALVAEKGLSPLWDVMRVATPREPRPASVPAHWRWRDVRPAMLSAGELLTAWEAERRVLMLINPSFEPTSFRTVGMIYAGVQLVLPGEKAPTHRHVPNAQRFVMEGEGAYTTVDGEQTVMARGDYVLTPGWSWHDHGNESDQPMMWLDGLDLPFVNVLDANFAEEFGQGGSDVQPVLHRDDYSQAPAGPAGAIINYRWRTSRDALHRLRHGPACPFDGILLHYSNPMTRASPLPTIAASLQLLRAGQMTRAHRHTSSTVCHVAEGRGVSQVGDQEFDWEEGDTFVVPSWAWRRHQALGEDAVLFTYSDRPIIDAFGLYREEAGVD